MLCLNRFRNLFSFNIDLKEYKTFLRKQAFDGYIYLMLEAKIERFTSKEFYDLFDVKYLPSLFFNDIDRLKAVIKKCRRNKKGGAISEESLWLGVFHDEDVLQMKTAKIYIKWVNNKREYGLFAMADIKKDDFVVEYTGLVRKHKRGQDKKNSYCFEYRLGDENKTKYTIDAKYMGNYSRFINHSENGNLEPFSAYLGGLNHIILKAKTNILKDTELTYDYGPRYWKKREKPEYIS